LINDFFKIDEIDMGYNRITMAGKKPYSAYFHDESDPDVINAVGNYSAALKYFVLDGEVGREMVISQVIVTVANGGVYNPNNYGSLTLEQGVSMVFVENQLFAYDYMAGHPIMSNGEWQHILTGQNIQNVGTGVYHLSYSFNLETKISDGVLISKDRGFRLVFILNDNFNGLVFHTFYASGYYVDGLSRYYT
jgi:hypothetical protein